MPIVQLADGSEVIFAVAGSHGDFEAQGGVGEKVSVKLSEIAKRSGDVLREAVDGVRAALAAASPSEIELEIGVSLTEKGSIVIASAEVEGSLSIRALWKP